MRPDLEARGFRVFEISTVSHEGLRQLTFALGEVVDRAPRPRPRKPVAERIVIRPRGAKKDFTIRVEGGTYGNIYRVLGEKPRALGAADRLPERRGRGLPGRPSREARRRGRPVHGGRRAGSTVVIGEGDGVVFDWQPTLGSAAELMTAPRGTDPRLDMNPRRTTSQRREKYYERMDAKAEARAELEAERSQRARRSPHDRRGRRGDGVTRCSRDDIAARTPHRRQGRIVVDQR